ncbi:MAG: response regulator transcription factor [Chloroflexi bacterium]|nr:response regulator transcription factor [Chloroflexota bacterium]
MKIKIFLADDHGIVRSGLRYLLEAQPDLTVIGEATSGGDAVRDVLQLGPDVVVLDIAMPELNGIEAARQIHAAAPDIQIIMLSMHATPEYIYQALTAGARGYVLKEAAGSELIEAIRAVYVGQRHLSAKISDEIIDNYLTQHKMSEMVSPLEQLSAREREILQLVAEGKTSNTIANRLFLSVKTIESYRSRLMQKLDLRDLPSLVRFAIQHGVITLE